MMLYNIHLRVNFRVFSQKVAEVPALTDPIEISNGTGTVHVLMGFCESAYSEV